MCGIVGVVSNAPVNQLIYDALLLLQHRGQDAAGIVTQLDRKFFMHKAKGMVRDVFRTRNMRSLPGQQRPRSGALSRLPAMRTVRKRPSRFMSTRPFGIVLVHNGNLTNAHALRSELFCGRSPPHQYRERFRGPDQHPGARTGAARTRGLPLTPEVCFRRGAVRCTGACGVLTP
jgi:amidophosphoribosyltransferase